MERRERTGASRPAARSAGAALVVALVLLLVLTSLAVGAMSTATYEVAMAGNAQFRRAAFDAAEAAIELALARREFPADAAIELPSIPVGDGVEAEVVVSLVEVTPVPEGFSLGADAAALRAFHFEVAAVGRAPRNAVAAHRQGFYVVGPGGP